MSAGNGVSEFVADRFAPAGARHFVRQRLAANGRDSLGDVAALLVSELVTNAVRHGRSGGWVSVDCSGPVVRIEVADYGPGSPRRGDPGPEDLGGRGLLIVESLATAWGVRALRDESHGDARRVSAGKIVWFELDSDSAE